MDSDTPAQGKISSTFTPPSDPSKFIRTYAKDVASLTNTPAPASPAAAPAVPSTQGNTDSGVSLPEFDASPVNHAGDPSSPKEFKQEDVVLSKTDSDDIFSNKNVDEDKEAILARLRAKVATGKQGGGMRLAPSALSTPLPDVPQTGAPYIPLSMEPEVPAPAPVPAQEAPAPVLRPEPVEPPPAPAPTPAPEEAPMRAAAPTFESVPEQIFPIPPIRQAPPPVPAPVASVPAGPSRLHTFSSDFADRIDAQKSSTFSVLAAQSDAGQTPKSSAVQPRRNLIPLFAGVAMVVVGIAAIGGAYVFTHNGQPTPTVAGVPSLITFDESVEVRGSGTALMKSISDAAQGGSVSGNIIVTYTTTPDNASSTSGVPQPGGVLIRALKLSAPDILLRNIDDSSTVGFIRAGSESRPFMILKVSSYERTFAGMLAWESTMGTSLAAFYPSYTDIPQQAASSTASTSPQILLAASPAFVDAVVSNYDVRVLRDSYGRSIMLYGYRGKDTLIIARDEAAFTALATRLSAAGH